MIFQALFRKIFHLFSESKVTFLRLGILYEGISSSKFHVFHGSILLKITQDKNQIVIQKIYIQKRIVHCNLFGKNAAIITVYTGSLALQLMNGIIMVVMIFSLNVGRVRIVMIAGALHPNHINKGTKDLP